MYNVYALSDLDTINLDNKFVLTSFLKMWIKRIIKYFIL